VTESRLQELRIDRGPSSRVQRRTRPWWVKWVVVLALVGLAAFLFRDKITQSLLPVVQVERVQQRSAATVAAATGASANGYIVARTRAALSADTPGRIVALDVTEGSVVKKGDVVARLYADEYAAALRRAEADLVAATSGIESAKAQVDASASQLDTLKANIEAAQAEVAQSKATSDWSKLSFDRAVRLLESGVGTADARDRAQRDLLDAQALQQGSAARLVAAEKSLAAGESQLIVARTGVPEAEARAASAAAARDLARATLDKTEVRAPFDGIVVLKDAEVGEVVSPNSQGGSNARGSVVTMVDFATLEVQAEVPETSIASVKIGGPARIYLDAYPDAPYAGRVDRVWPTANRTKATVEVRVAFEQRDDKLRPEMGVRVVFHADEAAAAAVEATILVPESAVRPRDGRSTIFVVEDGTARRRDVELGPARAKKVVVLKGIEPGDQIVVEGPADLQDGARVRVPAEPES